MSEATITYGTYAFHENGAALYSRQRNFENGKDGRPTAIDYEWTIEFTVEEDSFAANEAKIKELADYLASTPEAQLVIRDENDTLLHNRKARVTSDTTSAEWRQYSGGISITFASRDHSLGSSSAAATWTPTGSSAINLPGITGGSDNINTQFYHPEHDLRSEQREVVEMTGTLSADESLSEAARRAWLVTQKNTLETVATAAPNGVLSFGGQERTLRVDRFDVRLIGDGSHKLEWSGTFSRQRFPDGNYAEAQFEVSPGTNHETGEVTLDVTGTIRASTQGEADDKLTAIKSHYGTGRSLLDEKSTDRRAHGQDSTGDLPGDWLERSFSLRYRDTNASVTNWDLRITTRDDERTGIRTLTYSGRVVAPSAAAALAKAQSLGDGKHSFPLSSSEDLSYRKSGTGDSQRFVECSFSYDYQARTTTLFAEVNSKTTRDSFGSWTISISGYVVAETALDAETRGAQFALGASYLQTREETGTDQVHLNLNTEGSTEQTQFQRHSFSYGYLIAATTTSAEYSRTEANDFENLETTISYEGVVRGVDKATCAAYIATFVSPPSSAILTQRFATENYKRVGTRQVLDGYRFTWVYSGSLSESTAPATIISAEVNYEYQYSGPNHVFINIPYSTAHVQENVGTLPGSLRITGQVVGFNRSALTTWARAKRSAATGAAYADPASEVFSETSRKWRPDSTQRHRLSFNYPYRYVTLAM